MSFSVKDKKVTVVGLARTGVAAANLLIRRGAQVTVTDIKPETELDASRIKGSFKGVWGRHEERDFLEADFILLSPGVSRSISPVQKALQKGVPVLSDVELAYRLNSTPIIGVTGTNGKTTTTALIGHLLQEAGWDVFVGGNIGRAVADEVDKKRKYWILELSSFQLESVDEFRPRIGVILNLSPDHLDRYPTYKAYIAAKKRLLARQTAEDFAVLNAEDPLCTSMETVGKRFFFSKSPHSVQGVRLERGMFVSNMIEGQDVPFCQVKDLKIQGMHNYENAMAAALSARLAGLEWNAIKTGLKSFPGVEHRLEEFAVIDGVRYVNDSKATSVAALMTALTSFNEKIHLIAGGREKGLDFTPLRSIMEKKVSTMILIGEAADNMERSLKGSASIIRSENLEEAVHQARIRACEGDIVLLSPACASFDMFDDYEHRGREFKRLVREITCSGTCS
jgi:UDP-N-acetylmuramoylalanine--D-glutamate ligase